MARKAVYIIIVLEEMGRRQPPTPLQTDNVMADAVFKGTIQPKLTKTMDMQLDWLRDKECQKNSEYIGDQENQTMQTTGQSTIQQPTTKIQEKNS